ncbi:hypothetical protein COOONC_24520, partial [Cooperia oncophora]
LQASRLAPVFRSKDRQLRSFDSLQSPSSQLSSSISRDSTARVGTLLSSSVDSQSPSACSVAARKFSAFQSQDSIDSAESLSPASNGTATPTDREKKRGKWSFPGFRFKSNDKGFNK